MRMTKYLAMTLVVLSLAAGGWAQQLRLPAGKWWENPKLAERINLTAEQQDAIRSMVYQHAQRMIDLTADVKHKGLALADLVDRDQINASEVRAAFLAFQKSRVELDRERFELLLSVRQTLTTAQWKELRQMRQAREGMRDRREGMRDRTPRRRNSDRRQPMAPPPGR